MMEDNPAPLDEFILIRLHERDPGLKRARVSASWDFEMPKGLGAIPVDADLSCFLLNRDNQTREDGDFVFYNNPQGAELAVKHLGETTVAIDGVTTADDEAILVNFDVLPFDIYKIVFAVSIYDGAERDQDFSLLKSGKIMISNEENGEIIAEAPFRGYNPKHAAVQVLELTRDGVQWTFREFNEGHEGGLADIAKSYGLQISSTT